MKIQFTTPVGVEGDVDTTLELPVVPREGDTVHWGTDETPYRVHLVAWYLNDGEPSVYVVLR